MDGSLEDILEQMFICFFFNLSISCGYGVSNSQKYYDTCILSYYIYIYFICFITIIIIISSSSSSIVIMNVFVLV